MADVLRDLPCRAIHDPGSLTDREIRKLGGMALSRFMGMRALLEQEGRGVCVVLLGPFDGEDQDLSFILTLPTSSEEDLVRHGAAFTSEFLLKLNAVPEVP